MKLAKKISKGIALCAALAIMGAMGGVVTSCSNGSDSTDDTPPNIKDITDVEEVKFVATKDSEGTANTNIVFTYARSKDGAKERITIKDCDIDVFYKDESVLKITELVFALNEYKNDKEDFMGDKAKQYQCKRSIGKKINVGDTVTVKFNKKTGDVRGEGADSAKIDTLSVSLIDNDEKAGAGGWYNELVENKDEYRPLFPEGEDGNGDDKNDENDGGDEKVPETPKPEESNKETVIYKLDFSGDNLPDNYSNNCENSENINFNANEGVSIKTPWQEFSISPKDIGGKDLSSANYIRVSFKCSDDAAFAADNNRFMVGAFKNTEENNWADTNQSWTCFFDKDTDGDIPTDFKTVEKEINWEQKYDAEENALPLVSLSDISGFRIFDCDFTTGTLTVQSIEFIKK